MIKRNGPIVAAVVMAVVALFVATPAFARASNAKHTRFTVIAADAQATFTPPDFGQNPEPNQRATEDAPVYRDGVEVGLAETALTITRVVDDDLAAIIECSIELPEGNLLFVGSFHFAALADGAFVPVVGGTGRFAGWTGTVKMTASSDGSETRLDFDVTKP